jgi:hypothetical protein
MPKKAMLLLVLIGVFSTAVPAEQIDLSNAKMGESKKIKGIGPPVRLACPLSFKSAKADYASLR